jgi:hypothetical protein
MGDIKETNTRSTSYHVQEAEYFVQAQDPVHDS